MEELISPISRETAEAQRQRYGSRNSTSTTHKENYNFPKKVIIIEYMQSFTSYYCFLNGNCDLADTPTIVQKNIAQTIENRHPGMLGG